MTLRNYEKVNLELPNTDGKEKKYQQNTDCLEIVLWLFVTVSVPKVLLPIMKRGYWNYELKCLAANGRDLFYRNNFHRDTVKKPLRTKFDVHGAVHI
jgi:hypothetical protein